MKTRIELNEEDLKKIIKNQFRGLTDAVVTFTVHKHITMGDTEYKLTAEVASNNDQFIN